MTDTELVVLVAEKVMGWTVKRYPFAWEAQMGNGDWKTIWDAMADPADWDPLTDWNDMRDVVEKMRSDGLSVHTVASAGCNEWTVEFGPFGADHESLPRAICLAALAAKGVEVSE